MRHSIKEPPTFSVIIPIYNAEEILKNCLNSVFNQTITDFEVIAVDNNSTDNTKKIIKTFMKSHKNLRYIFEKQQGRGVARNAGIINAKGKIILMTDADCIVPKNWISELSKPIIEENEKIVIGFEHDLIRNFWTRQIQKSNLAFIKKKSTTKYVSGIDTKNFAIKASLMKNLLFDSKIKNLEDFDFYLRVKNKIKIRFLQNLRVGHLHKSSMIEIMKLQFNRGFWAYRIYKKHLNNSNIKQEPMFESISFKNNLSFLLEVVAKPFIMPSKDLFFYIISDSSWRIALFYSYLNFR